MSAWHSYCSCKCGNRYNVSSPTREGLDVEWPCPDCGTKNGRVRCEVYGIWNDV